MATQASNPGVQKTFPFMRLPIELRLAIYDIVAVEVIEGTGTSDQSSSVIDSQTRVRGTFALLLTSKTIRAEIGKALAPLLSAYVELLEKKVMLLEENRALKLQIVLNNAVLRSFPGGSVHVIEVAEDDLSQIKRQLDDLYIRRREQVAVHLALKRAADDS
jgi:hypothetical protein